MDEAEKNWNNERTELLQDQAGLQKLHNNLQHDYDSLFKEKEAQKETERTLRADLRKLQVCTNLHIKTIPLVQIFFLVIIPIDIYFGSLF